MPIHVVIVTPEQDEVELNDYKVELEEATRDIYPNFPNFERRRPAHVEDSGFLAKVARAPKEERNASKTQKSKKAQAQVPVPKLRKRRSK